jgi:predicted nucleotidyltransferase
MNQELLKKRLSRTKLIGRMLVRLPFVSCVILNGSLAQEKSKESSDIDIMIIAKDGRIFTARFFVNGITTLLRLKRPLDENKSHAGKFCFNHFLTEQYMCIPIGRGEEMDRYCAENFSQSVFVAGDKDLFNKFLRTNEKLFAKYNCRPEYTFALSSSGLHSISLMPRAQSNGTRGSKGYSYRFPIRSGMTQQFWDWFERITKNYQIKKIESDPRTKKYPDLIVYDNREMRFHPPKIAD